MSDLAERMLKQKEEKEYGDIIKSTMPRLAAGEVPKDKVKEASLTPKGKLAIDQAEAKKRVEKAGDVEMNVGQLRNIGEGPMVLRTKEEEPTVDAISGASPLLTGKGGEPQPPVTGKGGEPQPPVTGSIPPISKPQITQNGPPPSYLDLETPDMRMKETGEGYEQPKMTMKDALSALEKEEGPGFWDILEAAAAGWQGKTPAYAERKAEKRGEASKMRLMEKEAAINKANQLEILAKQAEIEGNRDQALAYQRAAEQQRQQANALALLEKEYALKKETGGANMMDYIQKLLGGK